MAVDAEPEQPQSSQQRFAGWLQAAEQTQWLLMELNAMGEEELRLLARDMRDPLRRMISLLARRALLDADPQG